MFLSSATSTPKDIHPATVHPTMGIFIQNQRPLGHKERRLATDGLTPGLAPKRDCFLRHLPPPLLAFLWSPEQSSSLPSS